MNTTYGLHRSLLLNRDGTAIRFENRSRSWGELGDRVARLPLSGAGKILKRDLRAPHWEGKTRAVN